MKLGLCCGGGLGCAVLSGFLWLGVGATGLDTTDEVDPQLIQAAALAPQSGEGANIKTTFNENVDRVRLMVLLSPT